MAMIGEVRRMFFRQKKPVREVVRLTSLSRNTACLRRVLAEAGDVVDGHAARPPGAMDSGQIAHAAQVMLHQPASQSGLFQLDGPNELRPTVGTSGQHTEDVFGTDDGGQEAARRAVDRRYQQQATGFEVAGCPAQESL